jgi:hypothetical protein
MVAQADGRVDERIGNYTRFWQSDLKHETNVEVENRLDDYTNVVNGMQIVLSAESTPFHKNITPYSHRLLRWGDRALRIRLGKVVPLLSLLQG